MACDLSIVRYKINYYIGIAAKCICFCKDTSVIRKQTEDALRRQLKIEAVAITDTDDNDDGTIINVLEILWSLTMVPTNVYHKRFIDVVNFLGFISCWMIIYDVSFCYTCIGPTCLSNISDLKLKPHLNGFKWKCAWFFCIYIIISYVS